MSCTGSTVNRVGGCNCTPGYSNCPSCTCDGGPVQYELTGTLTDDNGTWDLTWNGTEWVSETQYFTSSDASYQVADIGGIVCFGPVTSSSVWVLYRVTCADGDITVERVWGRSCFDGTDYYYATLGSYTFDLEIKSFTATPTSCDPVEVTGTPAGSTTLADLIGGDVTVSIGVASADCTFPTPCEPCPIPASDLNIGADVDGFAPGGSGLVGSLIYAASPELWTSTCINFGTSYLRTYLQCNAGNTLFTASLSSSTSACDVTPTDYTIENGTTSTSFVVGQWESVESENWDGVTAPSATITGWNIGSGLVTDATRSTSGANSLSLQSGTAATYYFATMTSDDGHNGDVIASAYVYLDTSAFGNEISLTIRGSATNLSTGDDYYAATFKYQTFGGSGYIVAIKKRVSGTLSTVSSLSGAANLSGAWYKLVISALGTSLGVQVIRQSDGKYLNSSGSFVTTRSMAVTATDSSVTGAGYCGAAFWFSSGSATPMYLDDYQLYGLADNSSCDPFAVDYAVIPNTALWTAGFDGFSISE